MTEVLLDVAQRPRLVPKWRSNERQEALQVGQMQSQPVVVPTYCNNMMAQQPISSLIGRAKGQEAQYGVLQSQPRNMWTLSYTRQWLSDPALSPRAGAMRGRKPFSRPDTIIANDAPEC